MESICTSFCLISFFEIYPCCCEYHQIIPFYRCGVFPCMYHITVCLSIQLSMDVWVVSRFQPLQINMLWIVAYKSKDICFHSLGEITRSGMAGFGVTYVLNFFKKLLNCFPKSALYVTYLNFSPSVAGTLGTTAWKLSQGINQNDSKACPVYFLSIRHHSSFLPDV